MSKRIFQIDHAGTLRSLAETTFASEDLFQSLLERYPDLLTGDGDARNWLLVKREMDVADSADGPGRWSLDHLFLDAEGVPTLVEVKRSTDTRLRREVVGQMLDYAANAVLYWPAEKLRSAFEGRCTTEGQDANEQVLQLLASADGDPGDALGINDPMGKVDEFWSRVADNLEVQRLRLMFVADVIPPELQRIVEYLNGQMETEVLAVELRPYTTDGVQTLVPRTFGQTLKSERRKPKSASPRHWDRPSFLAEVGRVASQEDVAVVEDLISWIQGVGELRYGRGAKYGWLRLVISLGGKDYDPFAVSTDPQFTISIASLRDNESIQDILESFCGSIRAIEGMDLPSISDFHHRQFPLALLRAPKKLAAVKGAYESLIKSLRQRLGPA